jgi:hypothetical protein
VEEDEDEDDEAEEFGVVGRRGIDLSNQELVRDHEYRPLWVDEEGNMYVILTLPIALPCERPVQALIL